MRLDHLLSKETDEKVEDVSLLSCQTEAGESLHPGGTQILLVPMRPGATPVPIPNTMVKTLPADGTMLETAWKSRWLPDLDYN